MNRRWIVIATALLSAALFASAGMLFTRAERDRNAVAAGAVADRLVRPHSPVMGPATAPVTIVEFFDPSCETCRALYPVVKQILARYPDRVRLVIRYAPLHQGSDEAVRILETARLQNRFERVLEALLEAQPRWAVHGSPNLSLAWATAASAGLDVARARREMSRPEIDQVLRQDIADLEVANVRQTPTFFVNGKPLPSFGVQQLQDLVRSEVDRTRP